jgi:hypothetical protein
MDQLKSLIREVPDFPKPGINFYDITTLLKDSAGFKTVIDSLSRHYDSRSVDVVLGIEARGFIIAPAIAYAGPGLYPGAQDQQAAVACELDRYAGVQRRQAGNPQGRHLRASGCSSSTTCWPGARRQRYLVEMLGGRWLVWALS